MISDKAIIDKNFKIESSIEVGPFSVISKDVKIGKNTKIHSHVVITGDTNISADCEIYSFASIGSNPQDLKFKGEKTRLVIGKKTKFENTSLSTQALLTEVVQQRLGTIVYL